jgi:hypothetical protein
MELYWKEELVFREEDMTTYNVDVASSVTTTFPWYPTTTHTYPYTVWTTPTHAQKCLNCGYCPCCGKSDIPGKLTSDEE